MKELAASGPTKRGAAPTASEREVERETRNIVHSLIAAKFRSTIDITAKVARLKDGKEEFRRTGRRTQRVLRVTAAARSNPFALSASGIYGR